MRKKLLNLMLVAMVAMTATCVLTACGGDDDDPIEQTPVPAPVNPGGGGDGNSGGGNGGNNNTSNDYGMPTGRLHIDISVEGSTEGWNEAGFNFYGFKPAPLNAPIYSVLYEGGKALSEKGDNVYLSGIRNYSVYTEEGCFNMEVAVYMQSKAGSASPLKMTLKGYINDELVQEKVVDIPVGTKTVNEHFVFYTTEDWLKYLPKS